MGKLYKNVHSLKRLRKAWSVVYTNGISSKSKATRQEVEDFSTESEKNLNRIYRQLHKKNFKFSPSHGVPISKPNKPNKKRPIVVSPVENKIVQRTILDILQEIPEISKILNTKYNFGGVQDIAVPEAVTKAYKTSLTHRFFIRTDIKAFFDNIPRKTSLKIINDAINDDSADDEFTRILESATNTELDNMSKLGRDAELFPLEGIGVAQGSCLSPLLCNLLLHDFDTKMNDRGIVCIRYIDDFIIFAKCEKSALKAFDSAKSILKKLNLSVYDPRTETEKAEIGESKKGFEFLGCKITPDKVRPAQKSQTRLKERIQEILSKSLHIQRKVKGVIEHKKTYRDVLYDLNNVIRGWGNSYAFCTDDNLMMNLDKYIDNNLLKFTTQYKRKLNQLNSKDKRRLLGVFLLEDCKKEDEKNPSTIRYLTKTSTN